MIFKFGQFELDSDNFSLSQSGHQIKVEPLIFDLLSHLLQNANTVQSKDELLVSVWSGKVVSDTTISNAIKSARKVLGDSGARQKYIKTLHRRGYSFVLDEHDQLSLESLSGNLSSDRFENPSLMILIDGASELADSVNLTQSFTQELERIFSRIPLLVIRREVQQVRNAKEKLSPQQIYQLFGVDYLLEGRLYKNDKSKVAIQLIGAKSSVLLSSRTFSYDRSLDECLIDECLLDTVRQFEPQVLKAVYQNTMTGGIRASAESKYIEASGVLALKGWHEDSFNEATNLLRESLALNSNFALASAYLSLLLAFGHRVGLSKDRELAKVEALAMTKKALDLEPHDSSVLGFCGCALVDVGLNERGLSLLNKALILNPENSHALVARGAARISKTELSQAIEDMEKGIALSPLDSRLAVWRAILANAYMLSKDLDRAYSAAMEACADSHQTYIPRVVLAGIEYKRGNVEECLIAISEAHSIASNLSDQQINAFLGKSLGSKVYDLFHKDRVKEVGDK